MPSMTLDELKKNHPCFGGCEYGAGRIHFPVSPGCNIACRFCDRSLNDEENRPGVASKVVTPEQAAAFLDKALLICPSIKVAGIAGPGDTLASDFALRTFRLIDRNHPEIIKCMSTNGLLLYDRADEIIDAGIDTITVTVNAVDPEVEAKLNDYIDFHGVRYEGTEGARILIANQLRGIRRMTEAGIVVKVNSVLVQGINDRHIPEIAQRVAELGAVLYNIIPFIPAGKLKEEGYKAPDCRTLARVREESGRFIDIFTHCAHCRADAVGVPGVSEYNRQVFLNIPMPRMTFSHG